MDSYENEKLNQEPEYNACHSEPVNHQEYETEQHTQSGYVPHQPYSGAGVGRKESPYADSPYVMTHGPYYAPYTDGAPVQEPPRKTPKYQKKKSGGKVWKKVLTCVLALAVVAGSCGITAALVNNRWEQQTERMTSGFNQKIEELQRQIDAASSSGTGISVSGTPVSSGDSLTPAQVYARNVDAVVLITCEVTANSMYGPATGTSAGSGFILTSDGYVVTNHHVIDGATSVTVTTGDGEYPAQVVGSDDKNDVAVLKVEAADLPCVSVGSSDNLIVGDQVVAIGNPLGDLTSTMTVGYVSAKDRDVTTDGTTINMLQTDVAINSGNSGGPLFNMKGEVVGITTAKFSGESASGATIEGIGFAIPIDDVLGIIESLRQYGYVTGAYLGISVRDVESSAQYYGVPAGAYVVEVVPGYCAEKAGLKAGDIIVELGGHEVESYTDLSRALRKFESGDTTQITVYRSGQNVTMDITFDEKPNQTQSPAQETQTPESMPDSGNYEEWFNYFAPFFGNGWG